MAIKVDLEKTYDRLSWSFIFDTLQKTSILLDFIQVTMECITTAMINVLWNGELMEDFIPSRGFRQGDPISPYIFVLCIGRLSHAISKAVSKGEWMPMRLSRNGTPSFIFADDFYCWLKPRMTRQGLLT